MKYLFLALLIVLVWWAWRRTRGSAGSRQPPAAAPPMQEMVICAHCGVHLPHNEAVSGVRGQYCHAAHRSAAGDRHRD